MTATSHLLRRLPVVTAIVALICVGVEPTIAQRDSGVPAKADSRTIAHVLNRLAFGARPGDVEKVQQMGLAAYIDQQLHPERIADAALAERLAGFPTLTMSPEDLSEKFYAPAMELRRDQQVKQQKAEAQAKAGDPAMAGRATPAPQPRDLLTPEQRQIQMNQQNVVNELMQAKMLRATMSERQLEEVLVDFWFNHFNVFVGKGQVRQYLTAYERDAIRPFVLGKFRDMVGATAHSPAMLFYLDNFQSASPNATMIVSPDMERRLRDPRMNPEQRRQMMQRLEQQRAQQKRPQRGLNENYARELMELHTLGVDGGYTQQDVIEVARILTGWTIDRPQLGGNFVFRPQMHDAGVKTVLGKSFLGSGEDEGERLLDMLAAHPSTARHIAFKLAQRFVSDQPPQALVDRAAKTFLDTKGDLREVTRVIVTSPEFFADTVYRAKVKTPLEFVASATRAAGASIVNAQPLVQVMRELGMPLYGCQPPTGYSMTSDAWVNTGALLNRMNFALQLVGGGQPLRNPQGGPNQGARPNPPRPNQQRPALAMRPNQLARMPIQVDVLALAPDTGETSRSAVIEKVLAGAASDSTRQTLSRAETPQQLIALALGSPEFQRR